MKANIRLGFAPTRRAIFSAPAAVEYRNLTADRLRELGVDFVDIDDINEEGLLYDDTGMQKIAEKFRREGVDGLFLPHANFGTQYECARLAKELNVPVIALSQLARGPEQRPDTRPLLSDLRDSGSIEQNADIVMFLYRNAYYDKTDPNQNVCECIVAKNRHGETGTAYLGWQGEYTRFTNVEVKYENNG